MTRKDPRRALQSPRCRNDEKGKKLSLGQRSAENCDTRDKALRIFKFPRVESSVQRYRSKKANSRSRVDTPKPPNINLRTSNESGAIKPYPGKNYRNICPSIPTNLSRILASAKLQSRAWRKETLHLQTYIISLLRGRAHAERMHSRINFAPAPFCGTR